MGNVNFLINLWSSFIFCSDRRWVTWFDDLSLYQLFRVNETVLLGRRPPKAKELPRQQNTVYAEGGARGHLCITDMGHVQTRNVFKYISLLVK